MTIGGQGFRIAVSLMTTVASGKRYSRLAPASFLPNMCRFLHLEGSQHVTSKILSKVIEYCKKHVESMKTREGNW
ncbi:putative SKP1 component, POZ domain-containing protein [Helianthus annuus]|uniref:SKP1 component, POZ domain-containing protein n=1 Tax=Helianthus annuus TaxID=4232 RepID=A0A251TTV3_HELAN|nr:putative SKP1 component, POZ domain-containing protein [Helianthus annuus]KAJ0892316.1 putative chromatin remodeling & transcription regulator BTB-POZ family [Helianthus annuus]